MSFRQDRFGLVLVTCSLLVIVLICGLHLASQLSARREQNRAQGLGLARLLSSIPYPQLVPGPGHQGPLDVVRTSQSNEDFAYGVIVDLDGRVLAEVTSPGVIVPKGAIPAEPTEWIGERVLTGSAEGPVMREFMSPVFADGRHLAHVRIGFRDPGYASFLDQASFLGMLALPIFLLTPLAYFLIRRGVQPVVRACAELNELIQGQRFDTVQIEASGEVGDFIRGFNRFMELAKSRIDELEKERTGIMASSKVVAYQKARIEAVMGSLPDATLIVDETGSVVFANAQIESILGLPPEMIVGHKPTEWCTNPDLLAILDSCRGREARPSQSTQIELSTGGRPARNVVVTTRPLLPNDRASGLIGSLLVLHDVTAEAADRLAQGEFVAQMAHELKAPLHVMAMYGESLAGEEGSTESFRVETSNVIRDEVERLVTLINTLLSIARIEAGAVAIKREPIRLQDFLEDAVEAVSRSARDARLSFLVDVPRDTSPIFAEKELLRVAINNLLTNAIKYNREGSHVNVLVEESDQQTIIRVRDAGIGIRPNDLPHIFEKFYRSDDEETQKRAGHGLGLPLAKEIVELHGGSIRVDSVAGEGSEFSIVLRKRAAAERSGT